MSKDKKVTLDVIGGGLAGGLAAALTKETLQNLYRNKKIPYPVDVVLFEKSSQVMSQTSLVPARQHLGGEYPLDSKTALKCLQGAMVLKQMMPEAIYTTEEPITYLIAHKTHQEEMSVEQYIENYKQIQRQYEAYLIRARDELNTKEKDHFSFDNAHVEALFFGPASELFKPISAHDPFLARNTKSGHFAGGIYSKEEGFNPAFFGKTVEKLLHKTNVSVHVNHEITSAEKSMDGTFILKINDRSASQEKLCIADYVVNAAWENSFSLEKTIDQTSKGKIATVYLRAMMVLDISKVPEKPRGLFTLLGESGGMYSPFNEDIAYLCYPSDVCTYVDSCEITDTNRDVPDYWRSWIEGNLPDKQARLEKGFAVQKERFPFLKDAIPLDLIVRPTVSFNKQLTERHHQSVQEIIPGWFRNVLTKGTYAGLAAIESLQKILGTLVRDGLIAKEAAEQSLGFSLDASIDDMPVILPESLQLSRFIDTRTLSAKASHFAHTRHLPPSILKGSRIQEKPIVDPYVVRVTSATAKQLLSGGYQKTMTLQQALRNGTLATKSDRYKYGFISPINTEGHAIAGEGTLIEGVCYWTVRGKDGTPDSITVMPPDTPITFGQIMIRRPDNLDSGSEHYSNQTAPLKESISEGATFEGIEGITTLVERNILQGYKDTDAGMWMACFSMNIEKGEVRVSSQSQPPIHSNQNTFYPSIKGVTQHICPVTNQTVYVMFSNFGDRIADNTDVDAPHMHIVPLEIVETVRSFQQRGLNISNSEDRKIINTALHEIVQKGNLTVGGHVIRLGKGTVQTAISYQPIHSCLMIDGGRKKQKPVALVGDRGSFLQKLEATAQTAQKDKNEEGFIQNFRSMLLPQKKQQQQEPLGKK